MGKNIPWAQLSEAQKRARRQNKRKSWEKHKDGNNYLRRVRYHKDPETRAKAIAASHTQQCCPEGRAKRNERAHRQSEIERRLSKARFEHSLIFTKLNLFELEHPIYRVISESGARRTEIWPPNDAAQRWLAQRESEEPEAHPIPAAMDTSPQFR